MGGASSLFKDSPLNTEDHPLIEYGSPLSASEEAADRITWFAGPQFVGFMDELQSHTPPESDPALSDLALRERQTARAGLLLARAILLTSAYNIKVPGAVASWLQLADQSYQKSLAYWIDELPDSVYIH